MPTPIGGSRLALSGTQRVPHLLMGWHFDQFCGGKIVQSGKLSQPSLPRNNMITDTYAYLSTILGYPLHVPDAPATHTHRIGFSGRLERYQPPVKRVYSSTAKQRREGELSGSQQKIFNLLKKQTRHVSAYEIAKKTPWTRNHCNIIMASLFKLDLLTRHKQKTGQTREYVYRVKGQESCQ